MRKVLLLGLVGIAMLIVAPVLFAADTEKPKDEGGKGKRGPQLTEEQQAKLKPATEKYTDAVKTFKKAVSEVLTEDRAAMGFIMQTVRKGMPAREGDKGKAPEVTEEQQTKLKPAVEKFEPGLADFKAAVAEVITDKDQANRHVTRTTFGALGMGRPGGEKGKPKEGGAAEGAK